MKDISKRSEIKTPRNKYRSSHRGKCSVLFFQEYLFLIFPGFHLLAEQIIIFQKGIFVRQTDKNSYDFGSVFQSREIKN